MPKQKSKSDELKNRIDELFSTDLTGLDQTGEMDLYGESIFRTAFENSSVAMCITGVDGRFMLVNRSFAEVLGYSQDEMMGKSFQELTHPEDTSIGSDAMQAMLAGASSTALLQKRYICRDGQAVWAELNITLVRDQTGAPQYFVSIIQNITEQKSTATMLDKRVRELNCLNDIGHKIDEQPPLAEFFEWVTGRVPAAMLYPEDCITAIEFKGDVYGNPSARDMTSKIVGGIRVTGELLGWLHIAYTKPRTFIDAESALVGGIVSRISSYVQTMQQQQEAERRTRELVILNEMALDLTSVLDMDALVETVYQNSAKLTDVTNFFLALYDPETETVTFPLAYSDGQRTEISPRPLGESLTDFIIRHGKPLLFTDNVVERAEEKGIQLVLYGRPVPAQSWLGVPIMHGNQVQGVIAVQSLTTPGMFDEYDQEVLTNIARSLGNALTLARQYQKNQLVLERVSESQRTVTSIVDFMPEAIFVIDQQSRVIAWNKAMENLTGFKADEMLNKGDYEYSVVFYGERRPILIDLVSSPDDDLEKKYSTLQRQGDILVAETPQLVLRGKPTYLSVRAAVLRDSKGEYMGAIEIVQDITERRKIEEGNMKRATGMSLVAQVSTAVASELDPQELMQTVVDRVKEHFNLYHAHLYTLDSTGQNLVLTKATGEVGRMMLKQSWEIPLEREHSLVARCARARQGLIVNDVRSDPDFLPNVFLPDTASEMAVPLIAGEDILGVLDVQSDQVGFFTEYDMTGFTTLAYQVSVALRNAQLYSNSQRALAESDALYQGSSLIASAKNADEVLSALVASTALNKLDRASILFFSRPWDEIAPERLTVGAVWERSGETSAAPIGTVYPFSHFPGFQLLDRSGPAIYSDVLKYEGVDHQLTEVFQNLGVRSVVTWPLKAGDEWFAIMTGQSNDVFHLGEGEIRRIDSLVNQSASVLQNLRMIESTRLRIQREQSLREITTQVRGLMEPDVILRTAVRELGSVLGRKTYILLGESSGESLDASPGDFSEQEPKGIGE